MRKDLLRIAVILLASAVAGFLLLSACFLIPTDAQLANLRASAAVIEGEGVYPVEAYSNRMLDNFTDALILMESGIAIYESNFINAIRMPFYSIENTWPDWTLAHLFDETLEDAKEVRDYSRYWHGYQVWVRPALVFFNYAQMRKINMFALCLLTALVEILLLRRAPRCVIPFTLSFLLMSPTAIMDSFQYSTVTYIALLSMLALLWNPDKIMKGGKGAYVFLASGIAVAFFDLLTFPSVALTAPLVVLWATMGKEPVVKRMLRCVVFWGIGYLGMWMGKWLIAGICDGKAFWDTVIGSIRYRSGTEWNGAYAGRFKVLLDNAKVLFSNKKLGACILCYALIVVGAAVKSHKSVTGASVRASLALLIPALIPVAWILATTNHAWNHTWFTYRTLAPCVFSVLCMLDLGAPLRCNRKGNV